MAENLYKLFDAEYRFMNVVWGCEPVNSTELTKMCEQAFGWKKPTTYTMIKKLCERGILHNEKATVTALIPREAVQKYEADVFMDKVFSGSVPSFIASFFQGKVLSAEEAREIKAMIDEAVKH